MEGSHHEVLCGKNESRQRKKKLLQQIREQLEFYFSPANLSKDLFMSELLSESEYVNLDVFLKFNKIRSMTETVEMLRKAVGKSEMLELSEDKTKLKLKVPYKPKEDELDCTIYVEHLPNQADHDWIRKVFSQYGTIDYISLPRYRQTGRPKGFAFVEFQNPAMAQVALKAFGSQSYRSPADRDPAELLSIKTYEGNQNIGLKDMAGSEELEGEMQSKEPVSDCAVPEDHSKKTKDEKEIAKDKDSCDEKENEGKRKLNKSNVEESEEREPKKRKISNSGDCNGGVNSNNEMESGEVEIDQENKKNSGEEKMEEVDTGSSKKKKKKRKRSKKEKEHEAEIIHLKVMSKQEWKTLRNRYLNMQKQNMQKLKRNMRFYKSKYRNSDYNDMDNGSESGVYSSTNYGYGEGDRVAFSKTKEDSKFQGQAEVQSDEKRASSSAGKPEFIPGVLVKISFEEPLHDPKKLRETIREGGENVLYVDASARESEVIVRFSHGDSAKKYIEMGRWSRMEILSDQKEQDYWKHIISCWEMRRNKRGGVGLASTKHNGASKGHHLNHQLLRGKDKVIQKAFHQSNSVKPNHVIFKD